MDVAGGVVVGVVLFVAADLTYQSAIVFYNVLLPGVAAGRGAGKISGYGTAAGYVGTIVALVGVALGGTWTVSRVMLVALSPPEKVGEFFGLLALAGRFSAVVGPALTATLLLAFGRGATAYRISVGSLAVIMALGIFFLLRVPDARPDRTVDEYAPLVQGERTGAV